MCEERKEPDHIGPVGHGKKNCSFTQNNRNWKNCLEPYCLVCKPQSNLCIRLHLTYPHIRNGLRISFYLLWSKALAPDWDQLFYSLQISIIFTGISIWTFTCSQEELPVKQLYHSLQHVDYDYNTTWISAHGCRWLSKRLHLHLSNSLLSLPLRAQGAAASTARVSSCL